MPLVDVSEVLARMAHSVVDGSAETIVNKLFGLVAAAITGTVTIAVGWERLKRSRRTAAAEAEHGALPMTPSDRDIKPVNVALADEDALRSELGRAICERDEAVRKADLAARAAEEAVRDAQAIGDDQARMSRALARNTTLLDQSQQGLADRDATIRALRAELDLERQMNAEVKETIRARDSGHTRMSAAKSDVFAPIRVVEEDVSSTPVRGLPIIRRPAK
jgi:hypothetical protein